MSNNQIFKQWKINNIPNKKYDIENISWKEEGLVIEVIEDGNVEDQLKRFKMVWDNGSFIAYHVTDETYRSDCWNLDFDNDGRFYATNTSEYIDLLRHKSPLFPDEAIHFTIIGTNTIVDLVAKGYPVINVIE